MDDAPGDQFPEISVFRDALPAKWALVFCHSLIVG
jgi:hypothetical protein